VSVGLNHRYGLVIAVLGVFALGACAAPSQPKPMSVGAIQPANYTPPEDSTVVPVTPEPSTVTPPASELSRGLDRFEGQSASDLIASLGDPNFRRRESPAEVWQYYGPGCILDLFLYDDAPGASKGAGKVEHAELRGRPGQPVEAACLGKLIDQRHRQRAG
jgi:hypothetical protein